ncbi:MAG: hypothetical protein ACE5D7_07665, partial [Fidelibacterota bacterium]
FKEKLIEIQTTQRLIQIPDDPTLIISFGGPSKSPLPLSTETLNFTTILEFCIGYDLLTNSRDLGIIELTALVHCMS